MQRLLGKHLGDEGALEFALFFRLLVFHQDEIILALVERLVKHISLFRIYCREGMQDGPRYQRLLKTHIYRHETAARTQIEAGRKAGVIRSDIPIEDMMYVYKGALLYRILVAAESKYFTDLDIDDPRAIEAHTDAVVKLFIKP